MTVTTELKKLSGVIYQSDVELHLALEKVLGYPISDKSFNAAKPSWYGPPYGEMTLRECLLWFGYEIKGSGANRRVVRLKSKHYNLQDLLSSITTSRAIEGEMQEEDHLQYARKYRKKLGLGEVVSITNLKNRLLELGAREVVIDKTLILPNTQYLLPYGKRIIKDNENTTQYVIELGYINFSLFNFKLYALWHLVQRYTVFFAWHPVWSVLFIMCDMLPPDFKFHKIIPTVISYDPGSIITISDEKDIRISIEVPSIETSPQVIAETYAKARTMIMRDAREVRGKWARFRPLSNRTKDLIDFVNRTPGLSWAERQKRWEQEYTKYPSYKNENTMAVVYSRAKKKFLFRRKENETERVS